MALECSDFSARNLVARRYLPNMSSAVANILVEFERLSKPEQKEVRRAIVEKVPMSEDLTDDDFGALAAAAFKALDQEEDARRA